MTAATVHPMLPRPGPVFGAYPLRDEAPAVSWFAAWRSAVAMKPKSKPSDRIAAIRAQQARWAALSELEHRAQLRRLRARLARDGFDGAHRVRALGCVAAAAQRVLGRNPYDTQLLCAEALLDDHLAEMATGEGKTLAAALAAAVAALAGVPVHVMTANDYLAARDAAQLSGFYGTLGLRTGVVLTTMSPDERRAAYACDPP